MNVSMTMRMDLAELERAMRGYVDELGLAWPDVIKRTTRLIVRDVSSITAPKSLAQGRKAVARDIARAIVPLDPDKVRKFPKLKAAITAKDAALVLKLIRMVKKAHFKRITRIVRGNNIAVEHAAQRDRRGRVTRRFSTVATLDLVGFRRHTRHKQKKVGWSRSGWVPGGLASGHKFPSWVNRHANPPGSITDRLSDKHKPYLVIIHADVSSKNIGRHLISRTIKARTQTMIRDVRQVLNGRKSRYFP